MSMLWQRLTERAKRVVISAQQEAAHAGNAYVRSEHLLLALLRDPGTLASKILLRLAVDPGKVRQEIESRLRRRGFRLNNNDVTLDPSMKKALDAAWEEARGLHTNHIGTEHLLLGILWDCRSIACKALNEFGAEIGAVRREVQRILDEPPKEGQE